MRVNIFRNPKVYSSLMYYIRGDWNKLDDVNTIIDPGMDDFIIPAIRDIPSGIAKSKVEQVILTHEHFDHSAALKFIISNYHPKKIIAFNQIDGVNLKASDGMTIRIGDEEAKILHTPGHSHDSICIYALKSKALFSGDTPIKIQNPGATYTSDFLYSIEKLLNLDISIIYSGHDDPITENCNKIIRVTYDIIKSSKIL